MPGSPFDPDLLSRILPLIEDEIVVLDRAGTILYLNRAWRGYDPEDAIGLPLEKLIAPEFHEDHRRRMQRIFETGEPDQFEVKFNHPDGDAFWYRGRLIPVVREGSPPIAVAISRDITAERRGESAAKVLETLLPLCSWCQRVRSDGDEWTELEEYLEQSGGSNVTHGICPVCESKLLHQENGAT